MPEFILDTSGEVHSVHAHNPNGGPFQAATGVSFEWLDLDAFMQGYIEALFFTDSEAMLTVSGSPARRALIPVEALGFSHLTPDALASIIADCAAFQRDNAATLETAYERDYDETQAGRDFWFTRNGHGVGFWAREALELASDDEAEYERLTAEMVAAGAHSDAWQKALAKRESIKDRSPGERLSNAAKAFGECDAYLGDDGRIYLS